MAPHNPRRFFLDRRNDVSGISGTGRVADGVLWPDGTASVRWRGPRPSTVHWDHMEDAETIHGHGGATAIVFVDGEDNPSGEPAELRDLPREVRTLVHAVDRMRDNWAEGNDARKRELWQRVHEACDAVWARFDETTGAG